MRRRSSTAAFPPAIPRPAASTRAIRASGQIIRFDDILDNLGTIKTDGWDFNVGWTLPERDWGRLRFDWKNTWVGRYELVNESGQAEPRRPGIELNNSAIPEWSSTLGDRLEPRTVVAWHGRCATSTASTNRARGANGFDICDDSADDINTAGRHDLQRPAGVVADAAWLKGCASAPASTT